MKQVARSRKVVWVLVWGVLFWGAGTALGISILEWHSTGHFGSFYGVVGRFVIFMIGGVLVGLSMWKSLESSGRKKKMTRTKAIAHTVLFFMVMLALAYLLWRMW